MIDAIRRSLTRTLDRAAERRWARVADGAARLEPGAVASVRRRALALRHTVDRAVHAADLRMAALAGEPPRPLHGDWAWRPDYWEARVVPRGVVSPPSGGALGGGVRLFHDCGLAEFSVRQVRNTAASAPYGLALECFGFEGTYLSFAVEAPRSATEGLKRRHILRATIDAAADRPVSVYARLNVTSGPNADQIVREVPLHDGAQAVEFDLAYTDLDEKRVERLWLDLIVEEPAMNRIVFRDLVLSRRPRAEI